MAYVKHKFPNAYDCIDTEVRNSFPSKDISRALTKCAYRLNHYSEWDCMINRMKQNQECLRCSRTETWAHVVQCKETKEMRAELIIDLKPKLQWVLITQITEEEIDQIIYDMRMFFVDLNEYEINQQ